MRLLMLDFDTRLIAAVSRALRQHGVDVVGTQSTEAAVSHAQAQSFDVALLDCDSLDPADLAPFSHVPLILTTSFLEHEGKHRLFGRGLLLHKPFTSAQLLSTLRDTLGVIGSEPAHLIDILRRAHTEAQSVGFSVGEAELFLECGELVHAQLGEMQGEGALAEVLAAGSASMSRIPARNVPRTIHRPFQTLMLELLHRIEVREQRDVAIEASESVRDNVEAGGFARERNVGDATRESGAVRVRTDDTERGSWPPRGRPRS
jgi:DNA-binding response OmpR family regulator